MKIQFTAIAAVTLALTGCASTAPTNYNFSSSQQQGIAAVTIDCNYTAGKGVLYVKKVDTRKVRNFSQVFLGNSDYYGKFTCYSAKYPVKKQLVTFLLSPGQYSITGWNVALGSYTTHNPKEFSPINFTVIDHKLVYVGNMQLLATSKNQYRFTYNKKGDAQDWNLLHQKFPNMSKQDLAN